MIKNIIIFIVYLFLTSFGLYKLKGYSSLFEFILGLGLYGMGFLIWMYILKTNELSKAFPIASGGVIVLTQIIGYFLLKEKISLIHIMGVCLIIIGIILIFSKIEING